MRKIGLLTGLLGMMLLAAGQEHFIQPPAKHLSRFPFHQLTGGVMMVKAMITGVPDSLNFILDTGSGGISLDSTTCAEYHIAHHPSGKSINGIAGIREVDFTSNHDLILAGLSVHGLEFYVNNYEILTEVHGEKVDGIIGYSFLSNYIVMVNVDSLFIDVYSPGEIKYPQHGYLLHPQFTPIPVQSLRVTDSRTFLTDFYFDTGAGLSLLISDDFQVDSSVLKKFRKPVYTQAEGLGGRTQMRITVIKKLKLGPYTFRRVPTHILDDKYNVTSYPYLGGVIGNDILKKFNLILNYPKKEIYLVPNTHYEEPFDYSYMGMSLYYVNGKIVLDDVIKGSPADKAGFKKDDIVMGVGKNFSNNLVAYKNILQSTTSFIKVLVMRNEAPFLIDFRPGRIY